MGHDVAIAVLRRELTDLDRTARNLRAAPAVDWRTKADNEQRSNWARRRASAIRESILALHLAGADEPAVVLHSEVAP